MKNLLVIVLTGLSFESFSAELDSIALITPTNYERPSSFTQTMTSKVKAGAADLFNINIEKKVMEKITPYQKDLLGYYSSPTELNTFIKSTIQDGMKKTLNPLTDENLIRFYGYLGNNLIGKFADKILEKEGVADPARRALWVNKMTEPFNGCIGKSMNSQYDASHCIDALSASLVPSAGIGIVYELSRASLNSSLPSGERTPFNKAQADLYKACIAKTKSTATDVKNCALSTMKTGVSKVTDISLSKTINEKASSKASADLIKKSVWPSFDSCTQKVGNNPQSKESYTDQFMGCIDTLVSNTGSLLVNDKITSTPAIKSVLTPAEVKKLAADKSAQFKTCAEAQKKKGARADGMLDISPCENSITNEVTYKVVSATLRDTASDSLKNNKSLSVKVGNEGVALLDKCWNNQQTPAAREACLRKTIVSFSGNVATLKLNDAIPDGMPGKAELNKSSVADLGKCIDKILPDNISEASDLNKRLGSCTGKLTHNVAMKVADYQIRDTAKGNLTEAETNALVKTLVQGEFEKCIGNEPSDETLEKCSNSLTTKAAKQISSTSFSKEVYGYLEKSGGLSALGLTKQQVDSFIADLTKSNNECIDKKTTGVVMDQVNTCIKGSVKKIAFFFGEVQFNKSVGSMYDGREGDKKTVEAQFKKALGDCLGTKDGKEFSISDYTKNLYTCSDKVSSSTTMIVGQDQIDSSLNSYLKDRPGMDLSEKRNSIRKTLMGNFQACMAKEAKQDKCVDSLKREATKSIVINYGRVETQAQLNTTKTPSALRPVEDEFMACADKDLAGDALSAHLDECTKNFAINFAKQLGALKLNYLLKGALGTADFNAQKPEIDDALKQYNQCLDGLKKFPMGEVTAKLSVCTDTLTARGMTIVRSNINTWMTTEQKDAATVMIKREFSTFLPCLSALLPASPYTQQMQQNIDSSVKPLAILLSHYIEYNPENAKHSLDGIIKNLSVDLNDVAKSKKAKQDLLDFLYQSGGLDQFIKAMVRGTVKDSLAGISDKDVPMELRDVLLKKENFEEIFNTPEGSKIKDAVMEKLLKPALVDGADMSGSGFKANMDAIKDNVVKLLIDAPSFGEKAIKMSIQNQINEMNGVTKFFAKVLYGGESLQWEKVRLTEDGKKAEAYIKEHVLEPKFKGTIQTDEEKKKAMKEAEKLVTKAVKNYG
nr:hypothetical protein BHI3_06630 [Bacteriovorax sp. HI3]